jgi:ABC-type branched-subunit amino acid transport system substrate-binding protein/LysM repeat protein
MVLTIGQSFGQLIHKVTSGETFYSLSKKYNVPIEKIIEKNPHTEYGLKGGMSVVIPELDPSELQKENDKGEVSVEYIEHTIRPLETFYSLKNKYRLSKQDILALNPDLGESFRAGKVIKIPVIEGKTRLKGKRYTIKKDVLSSNGTEITEEKELVLEKEKLPVTMEEEEKVDPRKRRKEEVSEFSGDLSISYLLPLFLNENDEVMMNSSSKIYKKSEYGIQFLEGAQLALKEWTAKGKQINVTIKDTENNKGKAVIAASSEAVRNSQVIIGPFYTENVKACAEAFDGTIIAPLSSSRTLTKNQKNICQVSPNVSYLLSKQSEYIESRYSELPVVLIKQETEESQVITNFIKKGLRLDSKEASYYTEHSFSKQMNVYSLGLLKNESYVVIIASDDKAFVTGALAGLNKLRNKNLQTFVHPMVQSLEHVDRKYLINLNVHFPSIGEVDYKAESTKKFIETFREEYGHEPNSRFAFSGYDITNFTISELLKDGNVTAPSHGEYNGIKSSILFKKNNYDIDLLRTHGRINEAVRIYKFGEFDETVVYPL